MSVFTNSGEIIYALESNQTNGQPVTQGQQVADAAVLPTNPAAGVIGGERGVIADYLSDPTTGLPGASAQFTEKPYKSSLSLDYLGAPYVGIGANTLGRTGASGAVAAYWSDMLADRTIGASVTAQGDIKDIGGGVFYLNSGKRLAQLFEASHSPYLTGFQEFVDTTVTLQGGGTQRAVIQRLNLIRTFFDRVGATAQYPFSMTRRLEFGIGANHVGYNWEADEIIFLENGQVAQRRHNVPTPPGTNYGEGSIALVNDFSYFGLTSPVAGGRSRFSYTPYFGGLNFQSALGDWRRYFLMRPVTFAIRGFYYGRFGKDASSNKLSPLFVGDESLIRGYGWNSLSVDECSQAGQQASEGGCPELDRLFGTRMASASVELRLPLFGPRQFGIIPSNFIPVEIAPFFDMGVTWQPGETTKFSFSRNSIERTPVFSTGVSTRINVLGFAVAEIYYAYPFQRPQKGAHWGFVLAPGW
jgi:hypothetical protein